MKMIEEKKKDLMENEEIEWRLKSQQYD